ncbi:Caltractin [Tritrichomonas foetus]|uniref:Caltractin n=1 Tax=Tritrichomonas foetus TaxID=1144522 RepID=A0A1J4L2X5_9EUKA|nr:Caltractin [Tritrichomonas foetus]|eukprot:OHT16324.1 Caltractin [Tritrichomonas foetus]
MTTTEPKQTRSKGKNELTDDQRAEIEEAFHLLDIDGDGLITTHDIKIALRSIGFEPTKKEILHMISDADATADGVINLPLFMKMMTKKRDEMNPDDEIKRAFHLYAEPGSKGITAGDIKRVSLELGENLTEEEIRDIIEEADRDGDGVISLEEFIFVMRKTSMF